MEEHKHGSGFARICSVIYLILAVGMLLGVCGYCYPPATQWAKDLIAGAQDSPVHQAFNVFSDGLEAGTTLREAAKASFQVLIGDED